MVGGLAELMRRQKGVSEITKGRKEGGRERGRSKLKRERTTHSQYPVLALLGSVTDEV